LLPSVSKNIWLNDTVFIIGGGPSLAGVDLQRLQGKGVLLAVNEAYNKIPYCNALFTCDRLWFRHNVKTFDSRPDVLKFVALPKDMVIPEFSGTLLERSREDGLSYDPSSIRINGNSGFGALNLAVLAGAKRIVLLGFDLKPTASVTHWHGGYIWFDKRNETGMYPRWIRAFETVSKELYDMGVNVLNINKDSAIRCFDFIDFEDLCK